GELARQLAARFGTGTSTPTANGKPERIGCDCGGGWRWEESGELLVLRAADPPEPPRFSYTLRVPGEVEIPELGLRMRVRSAPVTGWMFRGSAWRAALALPFGLRGVDPATGTGDRAPALTVRTRRPGDRIHPLGAPGSRKLKDLLIDRRIPRSRRDRIPLLCLGDRIAWVPGVTVDEAFRVPPGAERTWIAEVVP
ncbi:MAG: tRNA lysidine(34) synthetase TilS, partial [Acidobacteriota bacterium]